MTSDHPEHPEHTRPPAYAAPTGQPVHAGPTGQPVAARRPPSRVLPNVLLTLLALVLTPAGLGLLVVGAGDRYLRLMQMRAEAEVVQTLMVAGGLLLLVLVALLAAWAPLAPLVSGLVWGVLPGAVLLLDPMQVYRVGVDTLDDARVVGHVAVAGALGLPLVIGLLLVAGGLAGGWARRAGRRSVTA